MGSVSFETRLGNHGIRPGRTAVQLSPTALRGRELARIVSFDPDLGRFLNLDRVEALSLIFEPHIGCIPTSMESDSEAILNRRSRRSEFSTRGWNPPELPVVDTDDNDKMG